MSDLIDRQAAIDAVHIAMFDFFNICNDDEESPLTDNDKMLLEINKAITKQIRALSSAESELDEWCTDCKEYDQERHCCPRYSRVIRETVEEVRQNAQPEKTVYIPETKAIPSARSYVDLAEKVTATFYDEEHEEWTQKTVTIADVLDSVCDDYTILPTVDAEPVRRGRWITQDGYVRCSECGDDWGTEQFDEVMSFNYCPNCGAKMEVDDG